jgi:hypothetical protein
MSAIAGPVLIALAVLVGLVCAGWLVSSWLQDHYALPIPEDADRAAIPEREMEA